jgi:pimeloyl-ACP methyl ester carboxylesterase
MKIRANGVELEVEIHGPSGGEPLLLVMGLGMQLVGWHDGLVGQFVDAGFRVIRFDNRDIGLSQGFDELGVPNIALAAVRQVVGLPVVPPYTLCDMADDAVGLLDALGIASAHVCGASMGGMIAQLMALRHPGKVRSLTLIMTTSGSRRLPRPSLKVQRAMLARPARPGDMDSLLAHYRRLYALIGSPAYPPEPAAFEARLRASLTRAYRPQGTARQLMAILAASDRSAALSQVALPTLVIHGAADPLVSPAAAQDLARKIPAARLDLVEGMGHDLPAPLWPRFATAIAALAGRA